MNPEFAPGSLDDRVKAEKFIATNLQAIASSKTLVNLIASYLQETDEEKRKTLLSKMSLKDSLQDEALESSPLA